MAIKNKRIANTPDAYKAYLMEVIIALAISENKEGEINPNPTQVAEKWGMSHSDAVTDITRAKNILFAVKLFISKAVDDNWNNIIYK